MIHRKQTKLITPFLIVFASLMSVWAHAQANSDTQQAIENVQRFMQQDLKRLEEAMPAKLTAQAEERKRQEALERQRLAEEKKRQLAEQERITHLFKRRKAGDYFVTHELAEKAYVVNKDGTVYDPAFNIIWMRCSLGQTWNGKTCIGETKSYTWQQAHEEAKKMRFAGKNDWRLPTIEELSSLVYCSSGARGENGGACRNNYADPTILTSVFPNTASSFYWSDSPIAYGSYVAWGVYFGHGDGYDDLRSNSYHVRLVRGGQ